MVQPQFRLFHGRHQTAGKTARRPVLKIPAPLLKATGAPSPWISPKLNGRLGSFRN